ncbi:MAG TPA: YidB family protein [Gammaproteobacteria bacterium]
MRGGYLGAARRASGAETAAQREALPARILLSPWSDVGAGCREHAGSVLGALQSRGLGDVVSSWVGTGANKSISPEQVQSALGQETLAQFAQQAGVSGSEASAALAGMLPGLVDKLSPDGKLPDAKGIESMIGRFLGSH